MIPAWLGVSISFVYGIVVGSFLNVCIYRLPEGMSVSTPPSHCPKCNNRLKSIDLIPLLSFLFLGRKCRYCKTPISWRYFTIELITGLLFVAAYFRYGFSIDYIAGVLFISALIVAFVVDMDLFIIPDEVSIAGVIIGVGRDIAHLIAKTPDYLVKIHIPFTNISFPMLPSILGIVLCGGLFYLIWAITYPIYKPKDPEEAEEYEGAMGGGDVKLAAAIGAVIGWLPGMVSFLIAVFAGTIVGVGLMVASARAEKKGVSLRTQIPFGPHMVIGALVVMLFYSKLILLWKWWLFLWIPK